MYIKLEASKVKITSGVVNDSLSGRMPIPYESVRLVEKLKGWTLYVLSCLYSQETGYCKHRLLRND